MSSKAHSKSKIRQAFERAQAHNRLINRPDGSWAPVHSVNNSMSRDYIGGYRIENPSRRRR